MEVFSSLIKYSVRYDLFCMLLRVIYVSSYSYYNCIENLVLQVDESTFIDESETVDLPDGLAHFRMNLVELLVDICQLLKPTRFVQKVLLTYSHTMNTCMYIYFCLNIWEEMKQEIEEVKEAAVFMEDKRKQWNLTLRVSFT